jgi:hypothetical protein
MLAFYLLFFLSLSLLQSDILLSLSRFVLRKRNPIFFTETLKFFDLEFYSKSNTPKNRREKKKKKKFDSSEERERGRERHRDVDRATRVLFFFFFFFFSDGAEQEKTRFALAKKERRREELGDGTVY